MHVHPEEGVALSGLKHGLRPLSQNAMRFYNRVGYHDTFDNMTMINLDYGAALAAITIESVARAASEMVPVWA